MSTYSSDCECVQGIEWFLDPRPYMPSYESPDGGSYKTGYPWVDDAIEAEIEKLESDNVEKDDEGIDIDRTIHLYVQGTSLINKGYVHVTAYQVKSCYVELSSLDKTWVEGRVSLTLQHVETRNQCTIPVELGKRTVIPEQVLYPGTLKIAAICLEKSDSYSTVISECVDIPVYDIGIAQVNWGEKPEYDVYYNFQTSVRNLTKSQDDMQKDVSTYQIKCLDLETELDEYKSKVADLEKRLANLEKKFLA